MGHDSHKPYALRTPFFTPGVYVMIALMILGLGTIIARFIWGIGAVSNLDDNYPWGLWVGIDVATGVALAAGGFTTSAIAHIFGKHHFEAIVRPALLTAALGYTFVVLGLLVDIGRSWAIWKPLFFQNRNSVLFEVAMCVMTYLHVLYIEFIPPIAEAYQDKFPILRILNKYATNYMWIFIIAGVVLSCMHQSSLGSLMLLAPTKLHPLWYTPILPLLFLTSAFAVGYPMVIVETNIITSSQKLNSEMNILSPLSKYSILLIGIYLSLKIGDMLYRGTYVYLFEGTTQSNAFLAELILGIIIPWCMLWSKKVRTNRTLLFIAAFMFVVGGVVLNRVNIFMVGYNAYKADYSYFPSIGEFLVTISLVACLMFIYRLVVTFVPVLSAPKMKN